jgi:8-oxo-dGTP pyrophosphatase MutT (NUDIX family)
MKSSATVRRVERSNKHSRSGRAAPKRLLTRLPTDLSSLPIWGSNAARERPMVQSGVLAFRRDEDGQVAVLLVRKPHSKSWGIPKGNAEPHLSFAQNAAKEAFEEAGVKGCIEQQAAGSYRAIKRKYGLKLVIEVHVYRLEVSKTAKKWPEKGEREIKWCSPHEAAILLREPVLAELCFRLDGEKTG